MLAPIDAVATVDTGDEKIVLRLNMRTLALAKQGGVNLMKAASLGDLDPLDLATLVHAFAQPEQPNFTLEEAFALLVRYLKQAHEALESLSEQFASAAQPTGGAARPTPRPRRRK